MTPDNGNQKRGGPKGINWLAVRTYYIAGHTAAECAAKFSVAKRTVEIRRKEEGWGEDHRSNLAQAKQNLAQLEVAEIAKTMLTHIEYADRLLLIAMQGEEDLAAMEPGRSRIEARKAMLEAADKAVRIAREVRGFKSGDASDQQETIEQPLLIEQRRLETQIINVNERGRMIDAA